MSGRFKHLLQQGGSADLLRGRKESVSKPLSVWTRFTSHAELAEKFSVDPIYNMLDNYAGVLCSAFMHVKLFDALCWLGTNGDDYLSCRGKDLLVDLMGVVNKVCTEKVCSDLLTLPSLIEYAANSANVKKRNDRAYKASDVLKSLSNAFSVSKRKEISIYSANPATSSLHKGGVSSPFAAKTKMSQVEVRRRTSANVAIMSQVAPGRSLNSVTEELLQTSSGQTGTMAGGGGGGAGGRNTKSVLAYELKMFLSDASLDKSEFNRQMESSRLLGKEGKEPFRWDWAVVGDMLDYSFTHSPERLSDALKSKWVKRLSGFFRCAVEEKGYFANLEWEPGHLQYFDCGCQLFKILTTQEAAFGFMSADRRGMLFTEIVRDLEAVISQSVSAGQSSLSSPSSSSSAPRGLNVFRLASCLQTMAREYFALVGRTSASPFARKLITKSHLYDILVQTGSHVALDYLSRNVLTSLSFTDGGFISKDLMQIYLTSGASSTNLRLYSHSLLRALLRSRSAEVCEWGIEVMVQQMMFLHVPRKLIVHCMEEAAQDRVYLGQLIRCGPDLEGADMVNLSIRFLALPEGFVYLSKLGWVEQELQRWQARKCHDYSARVEVGLAKALNSTYLRRQQSQLVAPIPLQVSAFSEHPSAPHGLRYPDGGVDLEGLLRLPLNIEAKVLAPLIKTSGPGSGVGGGKDAARYIRLDSYLDTSELRCPASNEMTSDNLRTVKVRGIVLNAKGEPGGFPVMNDRILMSCLLCGTCPVSKEGRVGLSANNLGQRSGGSGSGSGGGGGDREMGADGGRATSASVSKSSNMSVQARRQSIISANTGDKDADWYKDQADVPVSALNAAIHDWTTCKPTHRTAPRRLPVPGDPHKYSIELPGEPAVFVFSTVPPPGTGSGAGDKASAAVTFLVEVHYVLSLQTGQSAFLPLPRHMYGEMARTGEGRALLANRRIVSSLLHHVEQYAAGISMYVPSSPAKQGNDPSGCYSPSPPRPPSSSSAAASSLPPPTTHIISSLWGLGHIAAIEEGFQLILDVCPRFVPSCIDLATEAMSYSVRSCAFSVLGLISRTESGSVQLAANKWEASPIHYVAVAVPDDPSVLFSCDGDLEAELEAVETLGGVQSQSQDRVPFSVHELQETLALEERTLSVESELLEAVGRLPGQLLYKETLARIKELKRARPEAFANRGLFLGVHALLEKYTFKLSIRRFLLDLFAVEAKQKNLFTL
jgi:rapamycin-insensitive companion of mTOR